MVLHSDSNGSVVHLTCGTCHVPIKDSDFDPSLLSLSKLQIDSITNNNNRYRSNEDSIRLNHKDYQSSNVLKQRLSTKKLSHLKNGSSINGSASNHSSNSGKFPNDLKSSSYVLLEGTNSSQNMGESLILNSHNTTSNNNSVLLSENNALSRNVKALEPIFQLLNDSLYDIDDKGQLFSHVKHPMCKDCFDTLINKLNDQYMDLLSEKEKYQDFLKKLEFHKQRIGNNNYMGRNNEAGNESVRSAAYTLSPKKKKRLSFNSPITSPKKSILSQSIEKEEQSPLKKKQQQQQQQQQQQDSTLSSNDIENLKEIQSIDKETQELMDTLEALNTERDDLEIALQKEKLLLSKMKKEYLNKMNGMNNEKIIKYNENLKEWTKISSDVENVHEDLASLRNLNIYNTVFNISTSDSNTIAKNQNASKTFNNFGTINGLRIGYNWRETNAALGQIVLCLCNLSIPVKESPFFEDLNSAEIEWYPIGSVSKIVKNGIEYDCFYDPLDTTISSSITTTNSNNQELSNVNSNNNNNNNNNNNWNFLFFKNTNQQSTDKKEFKLNKLRLFNEAMVTILQQVNRLLECYNNIKLEYNKELNSAYEDLNKWTLPYTINDDKINNVSIKYTNTSSNNANINIEWALSCKFMLANLRYLMIYRHKLFQLEQQKNEYNKASI
ncbi:hypothetical protein HANVADRAFT_51778 [Hanseniaspora valbyensis NRRL Y-1626]|uniref:Atg6 BARA domain-containing protein n=1 Tax=Hanseniaspora valbyensis NRRL Y-1626 TaxID=766949 RepID=A0A1B7THA0_9ASCO|nr:hypothetical protein HANVADRAFT_51778 [Hanseniaspora valbyensis NRRL Y-1626]